MVSLSSLYACGAVALGSVSLATLAESRMILPLGLQLQVLRQRHHTNAAAVVAPVTQELVDSYFAGSGFPKAGRTLDQKIHEAKTFLDVEAPKSGTIGTSVSIVYDGQVVLSTGYGLQNSSDPSAATTKDSMVQIGSVSKTFIAIGIALLLEEGKLDWHDPVKKHLPWLKLFDKYAEEHVTVGDLLSMNSGFARQPDLAFFTGQFKTERAFVEALELSEPEFSLREVPQYANTNFDILGQLIQQLSDKPWEDFLSERLWRPLGMNHTFASARLTPPELQKSSLTAGHLVCETNVLGPYSLVSSLETDLSPSDPTGLIAAGSIVSSAADMATFALFLLNKGSVGDTKLIKSTATITTMVSGKNIATGDLIEAASYFDVDFSPEGGTLAAGYGFDYVGELMWGHAYAMKGGATAAHAADLSLAPRNGLGVVVLGNTQGTADKLSLLRSYIMGIFLDVPKDVLDFQLKKKREASAALPKPTSTLLPSCGILFWKDPPHVALTPDQTNAFVGTYTAMVSSKFFPPLSITRSSVVNEFVVEFNAAKASYFFVGRDSSMWYFKTDESVSLPMKALPVTRNDKDGSFTIHLADVLFQKHQ